MFLWRPLAGRQGRTVLCADVDQALAGLQARQWFAAGEGRQGATQTHHGGCVVLFWRGERGGSAGMFTNRWKVCRRERWSVTCAPCTAVLRSLHPLGIWIQTYLHWQQLCARKTSPAIQHFSFFFSVFLTKCLKVAITLYICLLNIVKNNRFKWALRQMPDHKLKVFKYAMKSKHIGKPHGWACLFARHKKAKG